jgi:eukaryotic-like serine/threonine-protein kinase
MDFWQPGQPLAKERYTIESAPRVSDDRTTVMYMARDNQTQERVAIETPNPDIRDPEKFAKIQDRFAQEAQKLALCKHPNIIRVQTYGLFKENGLWCLPLEYLSGGTLATLDAVCLEPSDALEYVRQIGEALTVVHENNLVHGDVRPANLLVRGVRKEAVLTEFGLTREVGNGVTSRTMPTRWREYAPPEAIAGVPTPRSDLYMLGGTLYYLLTGRVPVGAIERQDGKKLDFTRVTDGGKLSGNLRDAIASAMELKEENRPESVRAWLVSLGFEVSEATGAVQKLSQEDLNYQEAQLKIRAQELEIKSKQWALAVTVITCMVGVIGWGMSKLQPTQPTNEPASQTQQETK